VIQLFSPGLVAQASLHTVPLHCDDIRAGVSRHSVDQRVELLSLGTGQGKARFRSQSDGNHRADFHRRAVGERKLPDGGWCIATAAFPVCLSAVPPGGKLDFKDTWLFDGSKVVQNVAVIIFLRMAPGKALRRLQIPQFPQNQ
jgi:hypothetical protein